MTRREWLKANPPPKTAGNLKLLLEGLRHQAAEHAQLITQRQQWATYKAQSEQQRNQAEVARSVEQLAILDREIIPGLDLAQRIAATEKEIAQTVKCPTHREDLFRHRDRPEDMFTCPVGPHHLLWARVNGKSALLALTELKLPRLDEEIRDGAELPPEPAAQA
jgi:hypothetical protein